ncbi:ankyrin repeat-containing domain protein [Tribonema minus]|uniref:Ankyrin repeat-containing domain protein n=1 Tax=Tribonema minus TaxID=303371 RepID=A0A835YI77_9STRA|nr:ankyrin repeat-containing domain protein [Tribonema minus]
MAAAAAQLGAEHTVWANAYKGDVAAVKAAIEANPDGGADVQDTLQGSTPLHWAAFGGQLPLVQWLVQEAGSDVNVRNNDGCTPLFFACEMCHTDVVQWLVTEGGEHWQ